MGQILTYGAGLEATTMVWIAKRFTEEHRATLDWLNEITDDRFNFFGLEIELWRIGNSPIAPKFNVICKPNEWSRIQIEKTQRGLTPEKQTLLDYWTNFIEWLREHDSALKIREPRPQDWMMFPIGRKDMFLSTFAYPKNNKIGVQIYLKDLKKGDGRAKIHFELLKHGKEAIENIIGSQLEWNDSRKIERSIDLLTYNVNVQDRTNWPEQHQWLYKNLIAFYKAFEERVKDYDSEEGSLGSGQESEDPEESGGNHENSQGYSTKPPGPSNLEFYTGKI